VRAQERDPSGGKWPEASRADSDVGAAARCGPRTRAVRACADGGEAWRRQVGRRSCGAKAAVRRDKLGGASMQPNTAVLQGATRVCRPCFHGTRACAKEGLARKQLDPGGSRRSCPSEPIRLYRLVPGSTTSNSSYPSWLAQPLSPRVTTKTTPSAIFHPRQPFPTNFFVTHGISSPSSTSRRQSYSPREFTFRVFSSTTKATPRFALIHRIFLMPVTLLPEYRC
jgi:hypothetical protein